MPIYFHVFSTQLLRAAVRLRTREQDPKDIQDSILWVPCAETNVMSNLRQFA